MSTTKTKTTRTATDIAAEKLTEALALVDQRQAEHEQAEETAAELVARLTRGDDKVTALDLVTAEAEITRLGYLIAAAKNAVKPAERALDSAQAIDSPTLARFVAERIEADPFAFGVYGMPVVINADDRSKPGVYVNQANATKTEPATGLMSGRVGITVVTPNGTPVDGAVILAGLAGIEATGAALVTTHASPSPAGVTVDVRLSKVKPDVPTLPAEVDRNALRTFGLDLADDIAARGGTYSQSASDPYSGGMYGGNGLWDGAGNSLKKIVSGFDGATVTSQKRDGDREKRTVRVVLGLASSKVGQNLISECTHAAVGNMVGEFAPGVGRITAGRVVSEKVTAKEPTPGQEFRSSRRIEVSVTVEVDAIARIAG
ncbi:hypothetical protein ACIBTW_23155 [Micromonospora parva]|uniref:hypothetical protein n=1 Tax=Micromonospora parva TaxID=1464048 RepID=UPI0037A05B29